MKREERENNLFNEVETVRRSTYLGDRVSAGGGCEASVTARTWHGWVMFRKCDELKYEAWKGLFALDVYVQQLCMGVKYDA